MHNGQGVTFMAGIVAAMPGVATIIAAPLLGRLGDRIGTQKILIGGFLISIACFIPSAFVTTTWQLAGLRFIIGIADASLFPQVQTLLTKNSPTTLTGHVFSWNQSAMHIGNMFGPIIGGLVAGSLSYAGVFLVTTGFFSSTCPSFSSTSSCPYARRTTNIKTTLRRPGRKGG